MDANMTPARVNDWVYSKSPGIWRVYRIIQDVKRFRFIPQDRQKIDSEPRIFSKRLVDKSWTPAFSNEMSNDIFVRVLSGDDSRRLEEYLANNPQAFKDFEAFNPAPIDVMVNLSLNIPTSVEKEDIHRVIQDVFVGIEAVGLTNDAILKRIAGSELARYAPKTIRNATLQFICKDHELRNNEYVFREVQLIVV